MGRRNDLRTGSAGQTVDGKTDLAILFCLRTRQRGKRASIQASTDAGLHLERNLNSYEGEE